MNKLAAVSAGTLAACLYVYIKETYQQYKKR